MTYRVLAAHLHGTADWAKKYFTQEYGATKFKCEEPIDDGLPLRPTWRATSSGSYQLCIEVRESPFSDSLYAFVTQCVGKSYPAKLWVAVPEEASGTAFNAELKKASDAGIGVVQRQGRSIGHVYHRPLALSLLSLQKTDLSSIPKPRREVVKNAEETFLGGSPPEGCQGILSELERITRSFAEHTYNVGWWTGGHTYAPRFFQTDSWAMLMRTFEQRIDLRSARGVCPLFSDNLIVQTRAMIPHRNSVSHPPKTLQSLQTRDAKLRTLYENARDVLAEWYSAVKPAKIS